jgi:molybdenum cofactor cytidylyltransferase
VDVVIPDFPPLEMKISVGWGLRHVERTCGPKASDVWLMAPADMPGITAQIVDRLLDEHDAASPAILVPTVNGRRGHPVLFPWPLAIEVPQLGENEGLNALTRRNVLRKIAVNDPQILNDLDTPTDYQRMRLGREP